MLDCSLKKIDTEAISTCSSIKENVVLSLA